MPIIRRDIIQILRDENDLLKARNQQISNKLAQHQQAFRVLNQLCDKSGKFSHMAPDSFDLSEVLNDLLAMILHACNVDNGSLILVDESAQELEFVAVIGHSQEHLLNHRMRLHSGVVGHAIQSGQSVLIENIQKSSKWSGGLYERLDFQTQSLMCVPLSIEDNVIGAVEVVNNKRDVAFDEHDLNVLRVATRMVSFALERIEHLAASRENKN